MAIISRVKYHHIGGAGIVIINGDINSGGDVCGFSRHSYSIGSSFIENCRILDLMKVFFRLLSYR